MRRLGSTTSPRARQMRRVLARWRRSGLTLREFGTRRGIPLSTLTWWRQVFRRAGAPVDGRPPSTRASDEVVFAEVSHAPPGPTVPVLEIVLRSGHVLRVPAGAAPDTLQRVLQAVHATC